MNFYVLGACFALAAFAASSLAASAGVSVVWPWLGARWAPLPGAARSRRLLMLRLFPTGFALLISVGLVLPAYLLLERRDTTERAGAVLGPLALVGIALGAVAIVRGASAFRKTRRVVAQWEIGAESIRVPGVEGAAFRVRTSVPVVALAGLSRPRLFIAASVLDGCGIDLVAAMAAHEMAHRRGLDNLKRLALEACADPLGALPAGRDTLLAWEAASEEAADDDAIAAGARPADLAEALVRVARLAGTRPFPDAAAAAAFYRGEVLARRVRRLVSEESSRPDRRRMAPGRRALTAMALLVLWAAATWALARPVHDAIERIVGAPASIYEAW